MIRTGMLIRNTICSLKDAEPARMTLTKLKKKSCRRIQTVKCKEVEEDMAKLLEFNKTDDNQNIDKRVLKKSPATVTLMMTIMKMTAAN